MFVPQIILKATVGNCLRGKHFQKSFHTLASMSGEERKHLVHPKNPSLPFLLSNSQVVIQVLLLLSSQATHVDLNVLLCPLKPTVRPDYAPFK